MASIADLRRIARQAASSTSLLELKIAETYVLAGNLASPRTRNGGREGVEIEVLLDDEEAALDLAAERLEAAIDITLSEQDVQRS